MPSLHHRRRTASRSGRSIVTALAAVVVLVAAVLAPGGSAQAVASAPSVRAVVLFRPTSTVLTVAGRRTVDRLAVAARSGRRPVTVAIVGFAAARRTTPVVTRLSLLRARAVERALRRRGVARPRVAVTFRLRIGGLTRATGGAGQRAEVTLTFAVPPTTPTTRPPTTTTTTTTLPAGSVACVVRAERICTTGVLTSPAVGPTASGAVTLDDDGTLAGVLTAALQPPSFTCGEFGPSGSAELAFDFTQTGGGSAAGRTKVAVLAEEIDTESSADQFDVCFQAPHPFPALRPSEYSADLLAGDFSNNTSVVAVDGQPDVHTGLLLPCSLGYGVPCIVSRTLTPVAGSPTCCRQRLVATVRTDVGDPKLRF